MFRFLALFCTLLLGTLFAADGNASLLEGTIPAGESVSSNYQELADPGEIQWDIQCDGEADLQLEVFDILGRPLENHPLPAFQGVLRPSEKAAGFKLVISNTGTAPLRLRSVEAGPASSRQKFTQAQWIWEPTLGEEAGAFAVFRTTFQVPDVENLDQACLYVTADDRVVIYLNDTYLEGPHSGGYDASDSFLVKRALKKGKNTLTCRVLNGGGPGALLCELHLVDKAGKTTVIPSDGQWRCAPVAAQDDWKNVPAHGKPLVFGKNGISPWGWLYYNQVTQFSARVEITNIPETVDENSVWSPEIKIHFQGDEKVIGADAELSVRLKNANGEIMVGESVIPRETLADATDELSLTLEPVYFQYIPDGVYSLEVSLANAASAAIKKLPRITVARNASAPLGLPKATLVDKELVPQFLIDGEEKIRVTQYLVDNAMNARVFREYKRAFDADVSTLWIHHVIQFDKDGNPDFRNLDTICASCLARNPEICIVVNPALDCVQSPQMTKFFQENPDALCRNSEGDTGIYNDPASKHPVQCNSLASEKWLQEAERLLGLLIEHLENTPYGRRVVAIAPSSGITWEWMYWGSERDDECSDYSTPFLQAFQKYAQDKYGTIAKANQAWKKDFASFQEIVMPAFAERRDPGDMDLHLPEQGILLGDLANVTAKTIADDILRLCAYIKTKTQGRTLTCVYYGYYNMITVTHWAQGSGHWALSRILDSDVVDMIQSPSTYNKRGVGEPGGFMPPESAIRLKGKVFITESDIRTHHSTSPLGLCKDLYESRGVLEREFGACLASNTAFRFYDFSLGWTFGDSRLAHLASLFSQAEKEILKARPRIQAPEDAIAVVISESAMPLLNYHSPLLSLLVAHQYRHFPRTGIPFNIYITPGLESIPLQHRFWFFESPIRMSREEIEYVKANVLKPGNTVVFLYGTNVLTEEGLSTKTLEELTGMEFQADAVRSAATTRLTEEGIEVLGNPMEKASLEGYEFAPKFYPVGKGQILARDGKGNPVLAQSQVNGCRVIFASLNDFMDSWIRNLATQTGLLCYNDTPGDVTWASGDVVTIHTPQAGERTIHSRHQSGVARNLLTGEEIPIQDGRFSYVARALGTDVFLCSQGGDK